MKLALVSNDDGPQSPGLRALLRSLKARLDGVVFVVPEGPRSASSMSLTFHKPVRVWRDEIDGVEGFIVSGSPADAVLVGSLRILHERPCVAVSGINIGDNTGLQDIFTSGTVAAAIQAALLNINSVAFSMEIDEEYLFDPARATGDFESSAPYAALIAEWICEKGLPHDVHLLNVNFPSEIRRPAKVLITRPAPYKYENYVMERLDPRGRPYYWVWGNRLDRYEPGTDAKAVFEDRAISITPLDIDLSPRADAGMLSGLVSLLGEL